MTEAAPEEISIRALLESDLPEISRLSGQLGYPVPPADLGARFRDLAGSLDHALLIAAAPGGGAGVFGWIHVLASHALTHAPEGEIMALVVDEPSRGRGVGAALVVAAEDWARARGLARIRVRCQIRREDAHRFYARQGFTHAKTQHVFTKPLSVN